MKAATLNARNAWCIAAAIAACLVWAGDAEAQRQQGTPQRQGTVNRGDLPRPQADLTCTIRANDYGGTDGIHHFTDGEVHEITAAVAWDYAIRVDFDVANQGGYGTPQFPVRLSIRRNGATVSPTSLPSVALLAGASTGFDCCTVVISGAGLHEISATGIVDVGDIAVPESNEGNNACQLNFTVARMQWCGGSVGYAVECPPQTQGIAPVAKLELTSVSVDPSNWRATARVKNVGNGPSEPFQVGAVFTVYGCFYQPILIPRIAGLPLAPGQEVELSKSLNLLNPEVLACVPDRGSEFEMKFSLYDNEDGEQDSEFFTGTRPAFP